MHAIRGDHGDGQEVSDRVSPCSPSWPVAQAGLTFTEFLLLVPPERSLILGLRSVTPSWYDHDVEVEHFKNHRRTLGAVVCL